jgi:hypothetical protein
MTDVVVRRLVATCAVVVFIGVVWWWWCRDGNGGFGVCCVVVSGVSWVEGGRGAHPRDYINNDERRFVVRRLVTRPLIATWHLGFRRAVRRLSCWWSLLQCGGRSCVLVVL